MAAPRRVLPQEIRFTLEFQPGAPFQQSIINSIMAPFNLDQLDCSINEIIYPTAWPVGFGGDPDIIDLPTHWVPWDDDIVSTSQYHFYVADLEVYESMAAVATATDNHLSMVPAGLPFDLRMETILIVHQLPMMQLMELVAQSADRIITLERRLGDAEAAIAQIRFHLCLWSIGQVRLLSLVVRSLRISSDSPSWLWKSACAFHWLAAAFHLFFLEVMFHHCTAVHSFPCPTGSFSARMTRSGRSGHVPPYPVARS